MISQASGKKKVSDEEKHIARQKVVSDLLHQIRFNLRVDRMGTWSKDLEGIKLIDLHILKLTADTPRIILGEIRQTLGIPNSTMTSAINRLENLGLLKRTISQRDKRSFGLELTNQGRKIRAEHDRVDMMIGSMVLDALDDEEEKKTLVKMLEKIFEKINSS